MKLSKYVKKRDLKKSPEPKARIKKSPSKELIFVIQEHHAKRLHYDLRLEAEGVLKSWAVPKPPTNDASVKRLAIMVEDHPYNYKDFEGTIESGYGAGTVSIWDQGTYSVEGQDAKQSEKLMLQGLKKGSVHFTLAGKKLKGEFYLVQLKNRKKNEWLLIKKKEPTQSPKAGHFELYRNNLKNRNFDEEAHQNFDLERATIADRQGASENRNAGATPTRSKTDSSGYFGITHPDKILWPKEKLTKRDLLQYYSKISQWILPHLKDRPESLRRFPNGITKTSFFQKNLQNAPDWIETKAIKHSTGVVNYLLIQNEESLLYAANLGCIELHPFFSRIQKLQNPDFIAFDLDPKGASFEKVIQVAQTIHQVLEDVDVPSYCKTSGATGLHIMIPLGAKYSYEEAKKFALAIAHLVLKKIPKISTLERSLSKRGGKVYIDCLQNNFAQTIAAPYTVRAKPGATVSTPLQWKEVKKGLDPKDYTIKTIFARLKKWGDLFAPVLGKGVDLKKALKRLSMSSKRNTQLQ